MRTRFNDLHCFGALFQRNKTGGLGFAAIVQRSAPSDPFSQAFN